MTTSPNFSSTWESQSTALFQSWLFHFVFCCCLFTTPGFLRHHPPSRAAEQTADLKECQTENQESCFHKESILPKEIIKEIRKCLAKRKSNSVCHKTKSEITLNLLNRGGKQLWNSIDTVIKSNDSEDRPWVKVPASSPISWDTLDKLFKLFLPQFPNL